MTVVEAPRFLDDAARSLSETERMELVSFVAADPEHGDLVPDSGGVRKLLWTRTGMGKRGGARVIYYFHSELMPLILIAAYAKNERADLTASERRGIRQRIPEIIKSCLGGNNANQESPEGSVGRRAHH